MFAVVTNIDYETFQQLRGVYSTLDLAMKATEEVKESGDSVEVVEVVLDEPANLDGFFKPIWSRRRRG